MNLLLIVVVIALKFLLPVLFLRFPFAAGWANWLLDSVDGVFKLRTAAIDDRVSSIDDTIARYERSVDSYEKTLNARFTAMETLLSTLQAQSGYLSAITTSSSS